MGRALQITDEQYLTIEIAANKCGCSTDELLARWIEELRDPYLQPRYYETDDWLRHLGVSEAQIRRATARLTFEGEVEGRTT